jgi:hypothetical protein
MTKGAIIALATMSMICMESSAAEPSIKGVALGEPFAAFAEAHPEAGTNGCNPATDICACVFDDTIGGTHAQFFVHFRHGKVEQISLGEIQADDFDKAVGALKSKFGNPTASRAGTVQNGFGASFDDRIYIWTALGWHLQAHKRAGSVNRSTIDLFTSSAWKAAQEAADGRKDDI